MESEVHNLVSAVWGDRQVDYILAGDPVRRKIEFGEPLHSTHQGEEDDMRDFAFLVRIFGSLISHPPSSIVDSELKKLRVEIEGMMWEYVRIQQRPIQVAAPRYHT